MDQPTDTADKRAKPGCGWLFIGVILVISALLVLWPNDGSSRSQALCADLDDGLTLQSIYAGVADNVTPKEFAGQVFVAVDESCPTYKADPAVRNMLENQGYLIPGEPWPS